jgi:sugar lactone lactonase YvrE
MRCVVEAGDLLGARLETLFVTSACMKLSPEAPARQPLAGHLLAFEPGVRGLEEPRYAG